MGDGDLPCLRRHHCAQVCRFFPPYVSSERPFLFFSPSASNVDGFVERSRVESGQMIGPRIFTVGDIVYGAGAAQIHQDIVDMDEAVSALTRIKVEGGPASISYKNYNIPSRYVLHNIPPTKCRPKLQSITPKTLKGGSKYQHALCTGRRNELRLGSDVYHRR